MSCGARARIRGSGWSCSSPAGGWPAGSVTPGLSWRLLAVGTASRDLGSRPGAVILITGDEARLQMRLLVLMASKVRYRRPGRHDRSDARGVDSLHMARSQAS